LGGKASRERESRKREREKKTSKKKSLKCGQQRAATIATKHALDTPGCHSEEREGRKKNKREKENLSQRLDALCFLARQLAGGKNIFLK
jgi:hypothetical protein